MPDTPNLPWLILLLPLVSAATIFLGLRRNANLSALVSTGSALITLVFAVVLNRAGEDVESAAFPWIDLGNLLRVEIGFTIDRLSQGMMLVVTGVGSLVHLFSLGYMKDDPGKARYFAALSLFMFSMTGIVLANNFVMMFIFWELVGLSSYLLIGHWYTKNSAAEAAKKAFLTNRIGDFGFLIGILLVWSITKSIAFADIDAFFATKPAVSEGLLTAAVLFIFCGAVGKSAQLPLHVWLPDAMEGPTPVSALIHAATMVAAGVYMLARVSALVTASEMACHVIAWVGAITALAAALMALQQRDIKKILAYSTLSQLGYMIMAIGVHAAHPAMFHLYTHAFFKALLFLGSGAVIYACHHEQDIWKMGGLSKRMRVTFVTFLVGTLALIAIPGFSGFWSKEAILEAAWHEHAYGPWVLGMLVAILTPFYMTRLVVVAFFGEARTENARKAGEVTRVMLLPLVVLAFLSFFSAYEFISDPMSAMIPDEGAIVIHPTSPTFLLSLSGLVIGVGAAWKLYAGKSEDPIRLPLLENKFYIDEIYAQIVRWCQDGVALILSAIDKYIIDGLIAGLPSYTAYGVGSMLRRLQSGNLHSYAFYFAIGVIVLLFIILGS